MSSSAIGSPSAPVQGVKTEWANNVTAPEAKSVQVSEESFGAKLNRMAGVVDVGKVKYGAKEESLSKEAFLKMTMEQIKYQDPLNPVQNEQFTQQMAMLSQLEQQVNMNSTLKSILDNSKNMQIAALQLVGKDVSADTALLYHDNTKATPFQFNVPSNVSELKVEVLDEKGEALSVLDVGARQAGVVSTKWDGVMSNGVPAPSGKYSYRIVAKGEDGKDIVVPSKVEGRVTGVTTSKGETYLLVGDQKVALNDVQSIHESKNNDLNVASDRNVAGMKNVETSVDNISSDNKSGTLVEAQGLKPQIEVSDGAKASLSESSELGSLFPLLYR